METGKALFEAVLQSPHDDAPRLVYADWLYENGQPERAEFIQTQCALNSGDLEPGQRAELQLREHQLLSQHGWDWAEAEIGHEVSQWVYRRGMVEKAQACLEVSADEIQKLLGKAPIVHFRDTSQFCEFAGFVEALPLLDHLTGLEFWGLYAFEDELVRQVLHSRHLRNLRTLILHHDRNGNLVDDQIIADGLRSPLRANVEELGVNVDCSWRGPSNRILEAIADSPYLRNLRKLNLSNAGDEGNNPQLSVQAVQQLAASSNLENLEELDLRAVHATAPVWEAILEMPQLRRLKRLKLCDACEVPEGHWIPIVGYIANLPRWREAFEQFPCEIDWETRFIDPWNGGVWTGMSWGSRKQQALFAMWPFIKRRDFAGLERRYAKLCRELATDKIADRIQQLSFEEWAAEVRRSLQEIAEVANERGSDTIFLRIRPDINWGGDLGVHDTYDPDPYGPGTINVDEPFEEFSYSTPSVTRDSPAFAEAARIFSKHPIGDGTKPSGPALYLIARTAAAFGRCLEGLSIDQRVFFSCMWAVFRMH